MEDVIVEHILYIIAWMGLVIGVVIGGYVAWLVWNQLPPDDYNKY